MSVSPGAVEAGLPSIPATIRPAAIIMAAGKSTRMKSKTPKPLHPLCGLPMTAHVIRACRAAGVDRIVVVVGHEGDAVKAGLGPDVEYAVQKQQRGTGDAILAARELLGLWSGPILALAGDVPLLPASSLRKLIETQIETGSAAVMLTAIMDDPTGYGRVVREAGRVVRIVEQKDASADVLALKEWNPSIYAFDGPKLWSALDRVDSNNAAGELYLTSTIGILVEQGESVVPIPAASSQDALGVNTRVELAEADGLMHARLLREHMLAGVSIVDPTNTYVDVDVTIGQDTVIEPGCFLLRGTSIGEECRIGPGTRIEASTVGPRCRILLSQVVESWLDEGVKVGPFANLRPKTRLGRNVKIGDFVETKNAVFAAGAQASHLSYIGDAEVGEGSNLGAGTITCNYDGYHKFKTVIGSHAFIGSHSTLVAPVTIGDGAFLAAGSAITCSVPADAMAIARCRPTIKERWAAEYHAQKRAEKAQKEV